MGSWEGLSSLRRVSEKGPVALIIPYEYRYEPFVERRFMDRVGLTLARTLNSSPVNLSLTRAPINFPLLPLSNSVTSQ